MHNINIMFVAPSDRSDYKRGKKLMDFNKNSSLLASKKFYEVDYIFEDPQQKHRKIQRQHSFQVPFDRTLETCQNQVNKSELIYKSMMKNMHRSFLLTREIPKKQPKFISQKDRSQVIHSRKSPRCHFSKRNSPFSSNSARPSSKQNGSRNIIRLIDPQVRQILMTPQGKRMPLISKQQRLFKLDLKDDLPITSRKSAKSRATPQSPKRRFWNKNYRPWSPQKGHFYAEDDLSATIDQFAQINL